MLAIFLAASGSAFAATILVWGDSLSAGYGLRAEQSWPSLLQQHLDRLGREAKVVNASVSGETTAGGRSRLPAAINRVRPDYLILALGANDGLRGLPMGLMRDNLAAMARMARDAGAEVLLVGMHLPPNYGPTYAKRFNKTFSDLAAAESLPLLPFLLQPILFQRSYFQPDGLHPTAEAQPLIMDWVWRSLAPLLDGEQ